MRYVSLKNTSLTYFTAKGQLSELSGSSKYNVWGGVIDTKEKRPKNKIENSTALTDFCKSIIDTNTYHEIKKRIEHNFEILLDRCIASNFPDSFDRENLERLNDSIKLLKIQGETNFVDFKHEIHKHKDKQSIYYKQKIIRSTEKRINKTKVKGKMYALFNLKCSRKFMAFYSVSFPIGTTDESAFTCWNYWLTQLRKRFELTNYIWVTERQKNGTLHYHMLTNNYLPILQVNRLMGIIINNQVEKGLMSWGGSSLEKFNGVDVDSIYNSKRHKKTGKIINPAQLRNWITAYVTKYVTKNNEKFTHLCWHCSRSISQLFTSTIELYESAQNITKHLPNDRKKYMHFKSDFNDVWVFLFVPVDFLFEKIRAYNDLIFKDFEPKNSIRKNNITFKTITL